MRVGFVGLGTMGGPMALHVYQNGLEIQAWNRSPERRLQFAEQGLPIANSLNEIGEGSDVVCLCVNRTEDVLACLEQLTSSAKPGTLFIDHSTILPSAAAEIAGSMAKRGFRFIDAPITGGSVGAKNGSLTIFCGGESKDIDDASSVLRCYAKRFERVGPHGAGQRMKAANQIAVGGALLALCESLAFAQKSGLDVAQTRELLSGGAAGSWAFENYGPKVVSEDWSLGFSIDNQVKDFGYCEAAAAESDAAIPATMLAHDLLLQLQSEGHGGWTTCALFELMTRMSCSGEPR